MAPKNTTDLAHNIVGCTTTSNCYPEAPVIKSFLSKIEFDSMGYYDFTNEQLEAALRTEMDTRNFRCDQLERTVHLASSLIEVGYHDCNFAEKKNMAFLTWFTLYADDMAPKDPKAFRSFEQRFLCGQPQLDPVLDALVEVLLRMWELYDPLCANYIVISTLEFITATSLEPELDTFPLVQGVRRFPWFIRNGTGVGTAFAFMIFTKSAKIDPVKYLQAIPDMNFWIALTNDVLSFHKEELAGESANYIHNRAYVDNKAPLQVLVDVVEELQVSRNAIHKALALSAEALKAWIVFERGYVAWHIGLDRYKLRDLGFDNLTKLFST
ncbi:terpenoid synthase [Ramaria rubella]|nr:terpenoid synthase [Ramaria rubella]